MKDKINAFIKRHKRKLTIFFGLLVVITIGLTIYFISFDEAVFRNASYSTTFTDRNGKELRTYLSTDETYAKYCRLSEVSPYFLRAIVLIEDKKFYDHNGISVKSIMRALWQNISRRKVVSGGSTITMQLAKMIYHHQDRGILNKISEMFSALKFEMHVSKNEILESYINRLPFGNMVYGVNQASYFYFGKAPSMLSLNQAIYLALIPKSPSQYNPNRHLSILKKRWKIILESFKDNNHITLDEYKRAESEGIHFQSNPFPFLAPHFIEMVREKYRAKSIPDRIQTTLDYRIQSEIQGIIRGHMVRLNRFRVSSAAAVVLDTRSHEVLGFVGSPDYFNDSNAGNVNLAVALRQPGSTLKPFVYGLALESGYTPSTILPDIKFPSKGGFFPKNHDGREHGPLRLRVALACSYNIPAFYLAMKLKPAQVISKLQQAGFTYLKSDSGFYGETIALGSGEVRLLDLATAYSAFSNKGIMYTPRFIKEEHSKEVKLFDPVTAFLIWDILSDPAARFASFGYDSSMRLPFPLAVKTGTSKGFKDKWAVATNSEYTVGVWIGNPSGTNMEDTTFVGNVSTILRDIFLALQKDWTRGGIEIPSGVEKRRVCALSGELATPLCSDTVEEYFDSQNLPKQVCTWHVRENGITKVHYPELYGQWAINHSSSEIGGIDREKEKRISFPQQGDFFSISGAISRESQQITFEVMGFHPGEEIEYIVDGALYKREVFPHFPFWKLQPGNHHLEIRFSGRILDSISFTVR